MNIFLNVMLPVLLVFLIGFILQKRSALDIAPISTVAIYIFYPCLIFRTFYKTDLNIQYLYILAFSLFLLFFFIILSKIYAKIRKLSTLTESGLILSTAFLNAGNYGAPVILFAYGEAGFAYAVIILVIQNLLINTIGIYYATRGRSSIRQALKNVMQMPTTYVVFIGLTFNLLNIPVVDQLMTTIDLIAHAAIPTVMLILGMQLAKIKWGTFAWTNLSFGVFSRLIVSPIVAFLLLSFLPVDPLLAKVLIITSAMPSAAVIVMYTVQFEGDVQLVSMTTLLTTIGSVFTVTTLLILIG